MSKKYVSPFLLIQELDRELVRLLETDDLEEYMYMQNMEEYI